MKSYHSEQTFHYFKFSQAPNMWDVHISTVSRCFSTLWIFGLSLTRMIRRGDAPGSWRTELISNQKAVSRERNTTQLTRKRMCFNLAQPTSRQRAASHLSVFAANTVETVVILRVWGTFDCVVMELLTDALYWIGAATVAWVSLSSLCCLLSGIRVWIVGNGNLMRATKLGKWAGW